MWVAQVLPQDLTFVIVSGNMVNRWILSLKPHRPLSPCMHPKCPDLLPSAICLLRNSLKSDITKLLFSPAPTCCGKWQNSTFSPLFISFFLSLPITKKRNKHSCKHWFFPVRGPSFLEWDVIYTKPAVLPKNGSMKPTEFL